MFLINKAYLTATPQIPLFSSAYVNLLRILYPFNNTEEDAVAIVIVDNLAKEIDKKI